MYDYNMESADLQHFLTVATTAAEVGTGPLTSGNKRMAEDVALAYHNALQRDYEKLDEITVTISHLLEQKREGDRAATKTLQVITETLAFCNAVFPPDEDDETTAS